MFPTNIELFFILFSKSIVICFCSNMKDPVFEVQGTHLDGGLKLYVRVFSSTTKIYYYEYLNPFNST